MTSNIIITTYKIKYNNYNTWFIGKINHNEFYKSSEGFSKPIFSYKYTISEERIPPYLRCNINYEINGHKNTFLIKLKEIDVINDKVKYDDFTKNNFDAVTENLERMNINVSYE